MVTQRLDDTIRRCALLCLALDSGWGGIPGGLAWIDATTTMMWFGVVVKHRFVRVTRAPVLSPLLGGRFADATK